MNLKDKTALVTGASSGIGRSFARLLAGRGANLVLVARRKDRLEALAAELRSAHGVTVTVLALDLALPESAGALHAQTEGQNQPIDILINNAGVGLFGGFTEVPLEQTQRMLSLNLSTVVALCYHFGCAMQARRRGHILNVASLVAAMPVPGYAAYAAGKAFVRNFSEALAYELKPSGVRVCALCPGSVATEFFDTAGQTEAGFLVKATMSKPDKVARAGLRALFGWRWNVVPGAINKITSFSTRLGPRRLAIGLAAWMSGRKR